MRIVACALPLTLLGFAFAASALEALGYDELHAKVSAHPRPAAFRVRQTQYADMNVLQGTFREGDSTTWTTLKQSEITIVGNKFRIEESRVLSPQSERSDRPEFQMREVEVFDGIQRRTFTADSRASRESACREPKSGSVYPTIEQGDAERFAESEVGRLTGDSSSLPKFSPETDAKVRLETATGLYVVRIEFPPSKKPVVELDTDRGYSQVYWIDPAKDFRVVREEKQLPSGYVFIRIERDFERVGGVWFMKEQRIYSSCNNGAEFGKIDLFRNMHGELRSQFRIVNDSIELDPVLADTTFVLTFPMGTVVTDVVSGATYRVGVWTKILTVGAAGLLVLVALRALAGRSRWYTWRRFPVAAAS